jgi:hypothetical protein
MPAQMSDRVDAGTAERALRSLSVLLWGAAGAGTCLAVASLEPNMVEEGLVVHVAQRLVRGEHLYRDVVFFTGPLPFELLGALFRVFGEEIAVGRAAQAAALGAAAAATFALGRRAGAGALAHVGAALVAAAPVLLFPLFSIFYYTPLAFALGTLAAWAAARSPASNGFAATAGALVASVALCKQTLGVALAASLFACVVAGAPAAARRARAGSMLLAATAVAALTIGVYAARGDLGDLLRCLVEVPLSLGEQYRSPYMNFWPPGRFAAEIAASKVLYLPSLWLLRHGVFAYPTFGIVLATQLLYALPVLALLATALARLAGPLPLAVSCNAALLVALATNLVPRTDWGHLVYVLPPTGVQLLMLTGVWLRAGARPRRRGLALAAALGCLALGGTVFATARWIHSESGRPSWGPRIALRPVSLVYRLPSVPRVVHFLRQRLQPGEPIFVARAEPLLYFATDSTNPTPYGGVLPVLNEEQQQQILAALPRVRYVVMSDMDQPSWTYYADELPRVQEYLERHYEIPAYFPVDDATWIVVLERGADRGATAIDLIAERPRARAFVRDAPGEERDEPLPPPRLVAQKNRRPLAMRLGRFGGGLDYEIEVPEAARFDAGIGFRGMASLEALHGHPRSSRMRVLVRRPGGSFEELVSARTDDSRKAGRRWTPLEADLSAWAGERVTLRLELVPDGPIDDGADLVWWGSPRIALPPPESASPAPDGDAAATIRAYAPQVCGEECS